MCGQVQQAPGYKTLKYFLTDRRKLILEAESHTGKTVIFQVAKYRTLHSKPIGTATQGSGRAEGQFFRPPQSVRKGTVVTL